MKTSIYRSYGSTRGWLGLAAAAVLLAGSLSGCNNTTTCKSDSDCGNTPDFVCRAGNCIYVPPPPPDMTVDATPIPDFSSYPDFAISKGPTDDKCPFGTKQCGVLNGNVPKCIPNGYCCTNIDCPAAGQTCQNNGSCACPQGQKACLTTCIAATSCCVNDDCPSKLCAQGVCAIPSCADGVINGNETDIDCGGGFCPKCQTGRTCGIQLDCRSNACVSKQCAEPGFAATAYGGASGPVWVVAADFNNDKKLDVGTANFTSNNASSLLGVGDATFNSLGSFSAGVTPVFVTTADVNGDQRPDLVVVNSISYDVSVLLGYGDGAFAPAVNYGVGASPTWAAIADVNGDKRADIVVTNRVGNTVSVLLGRGDGKFQSKQDFATDADPRAVVAADFNGDGLADLAVACRNSNKLSVLINKSQAGMLGFQPFNSTPTQVNPGAIVAADINGDRKIDLIVGAFGAGGQVFIGGGNGNFQLAGPVAQGANFSQMALVDMNADLILDLVTPAGVLLGNGNGSFQQILPIPGNPSPPSFVVGDFNGDSKFDFAYPSQFGNSVVVLYGNGDGTIQQLNLMMNMLSGTVSDVSLQSPNFVALQDLNGDMRADLLTTSTSNSTMWVQLANPNGSLQLPSVYKVGNQPRGLTVADINEDKNPDVVVANAADVPTVLLGSANGSLTTVIPVMGMPAPLGAPNSTQVAAADVNGDTHIDLIFSGSQSGVVLLGVGDGTFSNNKAPAKISGVATARMMQVVDFNGDGFPDLLVANGNSAIISVNKAIDPMSMKWAGFDNGIPIQIQGARVVAAYLTDLDGDMNPDLVVADNGTPTVKVLRNTNPGMGNIAFDKPTSYSVASQPSGMTMAKTTKDGGLDIITCNNVDRSVSILLNKKGTLTFNSLVNHDVGVGPVFITSGDVNGDGKVDFATANQGAGTTTILLNTM